MASRPPSAYWTVDKWGVPALSHSHQQFPPGLVPPTPEVLASINELEDEMRAELSALASFNEDERTILLRHCRREEAASGQAGTCSVAAGLLSISQFRRIWRSIGVRVSKEQASALFFKYGCDRRGLLPYEVYAAHLQGSRARLLAMEPEQKGAYSAAGGDYAFKGKITYRYCKKPVFPPSNWDGSLVAASATQPKAGLSLEWVYGYNGKDCTASNAYYLKDHRVVYHVAALGVVYDPNTHTQQFFKEHDDDITCLAVHPDRGLVATGQVASALDGSADCPFLHVWDAAATPPASLQCLRFPSEGGASSRCIVALAFSPCGDRLVVITGDNRHTVHLYDWRSKRLLHQDGGHNGQPPQVYGAVFNPFAGRCGPGSTMMWVTFGVKHLKFWLGSMDESGQEVFSASQGKFNAAPKADVTSAVFLPSHWLVTGAPSGDLLLWGAQPGRSTFACCCKVVTAHGPGQKQPSIHDGRPCLQGVRCLALRGDSTELVSAGSDGRICIWDITGDGLGHQLQAVQFQDPGEDAPASFRALDVRPAGSELLLGTHCCDLWVMNVAVSCTTLATGNSEGMGREGVGVLPEPLIQGHTGDVYGLAYHPKKPHRFVTACQSHHLYVWHGKRRQLMAKVNVGMAARSAAFAPEGAHLAVGGATGTIKVLNVADMTQLVAEMCQPREAVDDLKYSPDGSKLAAGSHDNTVYIYSVVKKYSCIAKCQGHSSYITHLDWAQNSRIIQTSCGAYELLYFDATTGKQVQHNQRDTVWASYTNTLGFSVMGIWPDYSDGTDINAVCRSYQAASWKHHDPLAADEQQQQQLLATAGDDGRLRLFNYPVCVEDAPARVYAGHSSHVMNVCFSPHNKWVASVGGKDRAVFQWRVVPSAEPPQQAKPKPVPPQVHLYPTARKQSPLRQSAEPPPHQRVTQVPHTPVPALPTPRPQHIYEVTTVTSDIRGASCDCGVSVVLYGSSGHSGEHRLDNHHHNFERGRSDTFTLVIDQDMGELQRLRIGHNGRGSCPRWHLASVVVVHKTPVCGISHHPVTFPCGQWFAADQGDGVTTRILQASAGVPVSSTQLVNLYKLNVKTSDVRGAGTDANVSVTLIGSAGSSGPHKLESSKNNFERGGSDSFEVRAAVGELQALRIGHDNSGVGPSWHLQEVFVSCPGTQQLQFVANRWLAVDEADGSTHVTLTPGGTEAATSLRKYHVHVYTSDLRGAGTDANVFIIMHGSDGINSGQMKLENSKNNFERGAHDVFLLELLDLGELSALDVWHDNKGLAAGWHLEQVVVHQEGSSRQWTFSCDRWLASDEDDGLVRRRLQPTSVSSSVDYRVTTHTSDLRGAGTDAGVWIELIGELNGKCTQGPRLLLDTSANNFERGAVDTFLLKKQRCLGRLTAIRIGHDNKGFGPGWHLDHVEVTDSAMATPFFFPCNAWLDMTQGDHVIERTLQAASKGVALAVSKLNYRVTVCTSDVKFGGTDANVFIDIIGQRDGQHVSSGRIALNSSSNDFERGRTDTFNLHLSNLGSLERVLIGHDNHGPGAAWHLASVEVVCIQTGQAVTFSYHNWLCRDGPPYKTEVELLAATAGQSPLAAPCRYSFIVYTSDLRGAGTDAVISCVLHGDQGSTPLMVLENSRNNFERGQRDEFTLESADVGSMQRLQIGHDNKGAAPAWHLQHVEVVNHCTGDRAVFYADQWLDAKPGGTTVLLSAAAGDIAGGAIRNKWKLTVQTLDARGAGTDADISVVLIGSIGSSQETALQSSANSFERSKIDEFVIDAGAVPLGELVKLDIGFASKAHTTAAGVLGCVVGKQWGLNSVEVTNLGTGKKYFFACDCWIGKAAPRLQLSPGSVTNKNLYKVMFKTSDIRGAGTDARVSVTLFGMADDGVVQDSGSHVCDNSSNNFERGAVDIFNIACRDLGKNLSKILVVSNGIGLGGSWHLDSVEVVDTLRGTTTCFPCGNWLDGAKDPSSLHQALLPIGPSAIAKKQLQYELVVYTSDVRGAGTDANISIDLFGELDHTGPLVLETSANNFERGARDVFKVCSPDVGALTHMVVIKEGGGISGDWHLQLIEVWHPGLQQRVHYQFNDWVKGNKRTEVKLLPGSQAAAGTTTYKVCVTTSDIRGAGTDANVSFVLFGEKGDTGQHPLESSANDFERGKTDIFLIKSRDLGAVQSCLISHDNSGFGSAWHLARIHGSKGVLGQARLDNADNNFERGKQDVFTVKGVDVGDLTKLLVWHDGSGMGPDWHLHKVEVEVVTSNVRGAGTDADVLLNMMGTIGHTPPIRLFNSNNDFERGQKDTFTIKAADVGIMSSVRLECKGGGPLAAWHLSTVTITNTITGQHAHFMYNGWIDASRGWSQVSVPNIFGWID
eukprot:gene1782-2116_t